jgi:hypothetical protein
LKPPHWPNDIQRARDALSGTGSLSLVPVLSERGLIQLGQTSSERPGMNVSLAIEIRPGYAFNVMVARTSWFPGPYDNTARP